MQFLTDVGSSAKKWVQNDSIPQVQIFMDASKKGTNTGYAFLASRGGCGDWFWGGALGDTSAFQAEVVTTQIFWANFSEKNFKIY